MFFTKMSIFLLYANGPVYFPSLSSKATVEVVHGLMGQVIKDRLFNMSSTQ